MTQFKVGDWVKCIDGSIQRIAEIDEKSEEIYYIDSDNELNSYFFSNVKSWHPKEGEWCWFSKNNSTYFAKLMEIDLDDIEGDIYTVRDLNYNTIFCSHCEPFIGELPSCIKETK